MNTDAAQVNAFLKQFGRCEVDELVDALKIDEARVNGALILLEAVDKVRLVDADTWEAV